MFSGVGCSRVFFFLECFALLELLFFRLRDGSQVGALAQGRCGGRLRHGTEEPGAGRGPESFGGMGGAEFLGVFLCFCSFFFVVFVVVFSFLFFPSEGNLTTTSHTHARDCPSMCVCVCEVRSI